MNFRTLVLVGASLLVLTTTPPVVNVGLNNENHAQVVNGQLSDVTQHTISWSGSGGDKATRDGVQVSATFFGPDAASRPTSWLLPTKIFFTQTGAVLVTATVSRSAIWAHRQGKEDTCVYHFNYLGEIFYRDTDQLAVGATASGKTYTVSTIPGGEKHAGQTQTSRRRHPAHDRDDANPFAQR
jgi:hypothetical protein